MATWLLSAGRSIHDQSAQLRSEYSALSSKLDQAMRQMELLRSCSYASVRASSQPRTSVFGHFYPHY